MATIKSKERKTRKGFSVKQSVIYKGCEYKIHSFPVYENDTAFLKKYRKDGFMDSRFKGVRVKISELKKA
jgi:hypothetical protein